NRFGAGQAVKCPNCGSDNSVAASRVKSEHRPQIRPAAEREPIDSIVAPVAGRIVDNIEQVIVGKHNEVILTVMAYFAAGHVLLEDVPGVAKTVLARAFARTIGGEFKRIQCTPDLLPNDITGSSIFNPKTTDFEFRPGPLFAQIVLADEINRATPRSQAALLEAMAERAVTVDGNRYELPPPFFLVATQNPIDHEGTFPLPEAQLDRFLVRLSLGYPGLDHEVAMLQRFETRDPLDSLEPAVTTDDIIACQQAVRQVRVDEKVSRYVVQIMRATREHFDVMLGGSPRASMALSRCAQAFAAIHGYGFVLPDDIKQVLPYVLGHRVILRPESRLRKKTVPGILEEIMDSVPVPKVAGEMQ
ncbi:MAG TPA: MoxR family ATPase, partial [Candidatus Acidoferrales bacterium]|nr:MoxR family ATPase [Candidatus Acidoferrales bacterium]